ncbi:MAG: hypothetical protein ABIH23_19645 [bacterium]
MIINKHNLAVRKCARRDGRCGVIGGIYCDPAHGTVATDGYILALVSPSPLLAEDMPAIEGVRAGEDHPVLISAEDAAMVENALPKAIKCGPAHMGAAQLAYDGNGSLKVGMVDRDGPRVLDLRPAAGRYPDYAKTIPEQAQAVVRVAVDPHLLIRLLQTLAPLADKSMPYIEIGVISAELGIRIDVRAEDGQTGVGVIMPVLK